MKLQLSELQGPDGGPARSISFTDYILEPLGYAELAGARLHEPLTIPLRLQGATIAETDIESLDTTQRYSAKTTLESPFTSRAIGLVRGGWLPSAMAAIDPRTMVLLDRNVVTEITSRFPKRASPARGPDFLDLFQDQPIRLNPLLFALEGNGRAPPGSALVRQQLDEVIMKLKSALPKAELMVGPQSLEGAMGLLADSSAGHARKQELLLRLAPELVSPISNSNRQPVWDRVVAQARSLGLPATSLVVLAVLSSVAVPNGRSPTRRLLKFKPSYGAENAYNALADIRALELLIGFMALYPAEPIQLCTADRDLALFWVGLEASDFRQIEGGFASDLSPTSELLPGEWFAQWQALAQG